MKTQPLEKIIKNTPYYYVNSNLTKKNFPIPEKVQTEGWKIIKMKKSFSSQEALDEIKKQGCRPANAYELALWSENHRDEIKKGTYLVALGQLWFGDGRRHVPYVHAFSDGDFKFNLDDFEGDWNDDCCLLCFCDLTENSDTQTTEKDLTLLHLHERLKKLESIINPELLK